MKIRPMNDQILVKRTESEQKSKGGIIIPDSHQVKSRYGEVLAVGPGKRLKNGDRRPIDLQPGQVVFFRGISGIEVDLDGESGYVMLREDEIEGVKEA